MVAPVYDHVEISPVVLPHQLSEPRHARPALRAPKQIDIELPLGFYRVENTPMLTQPRQRGARREPMFRPPEINRAALPTHRPQFHPYARPREPAPTRNQVQSMIDGRSEQAHDGIKSNPDATNMMPFKKESPTTQTLQQYNDPIENPVRNDLIVIGEHPARPFIPKFGDLAQRARLPDSLTHPLGGGARARQQRRSIRTHSPPTRAQKIKDDIRLRTEYDEKTPQ